MPDTEDLHDLVQEYESYSELLDRVDDDERSCQLINAVGGVGEEVERVIQADCEEIGSQEAGWLRLLWEAHHESELSENTSRTNRPR